MRHLLKTIFLLPLLAIGTIALAGEKPAAKTKPYVPKHEVTVSASIAYNSFLYSLQPGEDKGLKTAYLDAFSFSICVFPFDVTYTYHFNKNWGITTGVGLNAFGTVIDETGSHLKYKSGTYPIPTVDSDPPAFIETAPIGMKYKYNHEDNSMSQIIVTVPVLAQYMLPFGNGSWNFYAQGGLKLGVHVYGEKFSEISSKIMSSEVGIYRYGNSWKTITNDEEEEEISSSRVGTTDSNFRRVNLFASLETGIRIPLWRCLGMYVGGYADLGLLRATKVSNYTYSAANTGELLSTLFSAREERYTISATESEYTVTAGKKGYLRGLLPISAGMKIRIAF